MSPKTAFRPASAPARRRDAAPRGLVLHGLERRLRRHDRSTRPHQRRRISHRRAPRRPAPPGRRAGVRPNRHAGVSVHREPPRRIRTGVHGGAGAGGRAREARRGRLGWAPIAVGVVERAPGVRFGDIEVDTARLRNAFEESGGDLAAYLQTLLAVAVPCELDFGRLRVYWWRVADRPLPRTAHATSDGENAPSSR